MYIIVTIADLIQISPQDFEKRSAQAIEDNINLKYADKVIHRVGLCVALYDILQTSEGLIGHGTGIVNVNVDFRMIVFRPFKGEILTGKILSSSDMGIRISMGFFDDIFVPAPGMLFEPAKHHLTEDGERVWVWETAPDNLLYFDVNEVVKFRVEAETWTDLSPEKQPAPGEEVEVYRRSPYEITASMQLSGLGPAFWWREPDEEEAAEEGEEEADGGAEDMNGDAVDVMDEGV
ncbi:hypothetical protein D6D19_09391 [Aureobasidium pullulans]|uniref:DNA-directed RNA polymerase subunit n=3 Tax=Aureobasidium pullulans TaxID=5580 RepID=A0A074YN44_AURPU|nr:uncharacterized protein M438DRAFT_371244 [Aureobasidium pullulans EXF-150]THV66176.1 hypothetical protein D6D28_08553 [Aureobasidium pullulans]KEQ88291.1 hypothetical protein M438DRAFT_371244 [Aureobasidium pullulans EXF-150]THW01713.1 hypothetical protein D6D26_04892 [Aureobasidium pullulans]THW09013.1 hypothetical protein D6D24_08729 [Aureobasidium pullulans]THW54230.1 hypothetical protein D6D20_10355 [Aureobasidium pullulans]